MKPPPPFAEQLRSLVREKLGLGGRHVLGARGKPELVALFKNHVHWLGLLCPQAQDLQALRQEPDEGGTWAALPDELQALDSDTLDAFLWQGRLEADWPELQKALRRVLRLNSHVILWQADWQAEQGAFTGALAQWQTLFRPDFRGGDSSETLLAFFPHGYETYYLSQKLELSWAEIQAQADFDALSPQGQRALSLLFRQHERGDKVEVWRRHQIHAGLYNRYTPAISLRKSLFFYLLKPFAFSFYLLVKLNIYFWRFIYRLRGRG